MLPDISRCPDHPVNSPDSMPFLTIGMHLQQFGATAEETVAYDKDTVKQNAAIRNQRRADKPNRKSIHARLYEHMRTMGNQGTRPTNHDMGPQYLPQLGVRGPREQFGTTPVHKPLTTNQDNTQLPMGTS